MSNKTELSDEEISRLRAQAEAGNRLLAECRQSIDGTPMSKRFCGDETQLADLKNITRGVAAQQETK